MTTNDQHSVKADTQYVVFEQVDLTDRADAKAWLAMGTFSARDAMAAIKAAVEDIPETLRRDAGYTCVAIPARSFNPMSVRPKVTTTLVLEEARS